jgi:hypothetical protein
VATNGAGLDRPILVGGTGRSGSTIVGHLLDHHPDLTLTRPMEVRFIAGNDGLADALAIALRKPGGPRAVAATRLAAERLMQRWFERAPEVGLHQSMSREEVERWAHQYRVDMETDPLAATRELTYRIMGRIASRLEADRLVDTTPANARKADRTEPIYPESTVVVVTRDGRDVAASFVSQSFGPDDVFAALEQWEQRMIRTQRAVSACRPGRVMEIQLMDLVVNDREGTLERLCAHVGVPVDPDMVSWFDSHVTADGAHPGRWRRDFDEETVRRIDANYGEIVERLAALGIDIPS